MAGITIGGLTYIRAGELCVGDCDRCSIVATIDELMDEEDGMTDYIKREDAIKAMAQYLMDMALIDNPEASDRIEEWEGSIAAPVMSTVKAADVRENVKGEWIEDNSREKSMMWRCSVCGRIAYYPTIGERKNYKKHCGYNFCPNCGADMRGEA